jgi:hypothetical protein
MISQQKSQREEMVIVESQVAAAADDDDHDLKLNCMATDPEEESRDPVGFAGFAGFAGTASPPTSSAASSSSSSSSSSACEPTVPNPISATTPASTSHVAATSTTKMTTTTTTPSSLGVTKDCTEDVHGQNDVPPQIMDSQTTRFVIENGGMKTTKATTATATATTKATDSIIASDPTKQNYPSTSSTTADRHIFDVPFDPMMTTASTKFHSEKRIANQTNRRDMDDSTSSFSPLPFKNRNPTHSHDDDDDDDHDVAVVSKTSQKATRARRISYSHNEKQQIFSQRIDNSLTRTDHHHQRNERILLPLSPSQHDDVSLIIQSPESWLVYTRSFLADFMKISFKCEDIVETGPMDVLCGGSHNYQSYVKYSGNMILQKVNMMRFVYRNKCKV